SECLHCKYAIPDDQLSTCWYGYALPENGHLGVTMRLSYNGYCLLHRATGQRFRFPLRGFLHAFCNFQNPQYKNSILYGSERLYLFPVLESLFLLVVTRSQELIKRIDTAHV